MSGLTDRQRDIVAAVADLTTRLGYPPTYREIAKAVGLASVSSVADHVDSLRLAGVLTTNRFSARSVRLAEGVAPVTNGPAGISDEAAHQPANDCKESPAMSSIPEATRRPAFLNKDDVLSKHPHTGEPGQWTVALPPVVQGEDVWVSVRDSEQAPAVFVIGRDHQVSVIDGERAMTVAAVRALADFLDAHPDVPLSHVQAKYFPNHLVFGDTAARVAEVDRIGDVIGVEAGPSHKGDPHHYAKHNFGHGVIYEAVAASAYPEDDAVAPEAEAAS